MKTLNVQKYASYTVCNYKKNPKQPSCKIVCGPEESHCEKDARIPLQPFLGHLFTNFSQ